MHVNPEILKRIEEMKKSGQATEGPAADLSAVHCDGGHSGLLLPDQLEVRVGSMCPDGISEADLQKGCISVGHLLGWKIAHFRSVRVLQKDGGFHYECPVEADGKGFMDLLCIHEGMGKLFVTELKVPPNTPSPEQIAWLTAFRAAGIPAYIWRPADWKEIVAAFRGQLPEPKEFR